jgi:hypothetical protein
MHLLALLLLAAPLSPDGYPTRRGTAGVSFFIPGTGEPRVGGTYFLYNDLAARLDVGVVAPVTPGGPGQNLLFNATLGLRFYALKRNHAAVFLQPSGGLGRENSPAVSAEAAFFFRLGAGIGVEYFFTETFAAGAVLEATLKFANLNGPAGTPIYTTLSTNTSGLSANIYF